MSSFLAFRIAAASVLHPRRLHQPGTDLLLKSPFLHICSRGMKNKRTYPINGQIPYLVVQVQDEDGTLHHAHNLKSLLQSVDKKTHLVRLVSHEPPIVRIVTHLEDEMSKLERKAEKKATRSRGRIEMKEVRLSWLTREAEYEHKMALAKEELAKGDVRIDFCFSPKKGVRAPSQAEMEEQIQKVADMFADVSNEWKQREFARGQAKIYLQSIVRQSTALPTKDEIEDMAKKKLEVRERTLKHTQKIGDPVKMA